ncbi:MAG TPA: hypothetical protein VGP07_11030 [Polyangia bacterium]|jgi:hypothetical protein
MTTSAALKWGLGPLVLAALAAAVGHGRSAPPAGPLVAAVAARPEAERKALEEAPWLATANASWAFGSLDSVKRAFRTEIDRLPETEGAWRARAFLRFGIVDTNPDGQAAVFAQACAADAYDCDHLKERVEREIKVRFVSPGNYLPLYFIPGHPPVPAF